MSKDKFYDVRDAMALDIAGGYYCRHVSAMTAEGLHSKSDIAAELGWRDMQIAEIQRKVEALAVENNTLKTAHPQPFGLEMMKAIDAYIKHQDEVPETGMLDAYFIMRDSIRVETPATDAELAEIRAQGVERLRDYHKNRYEALKDINRKEANRHAEAMLCANDMVNELRKESGQ